MKVDEEGLREKIYITDQNQYNSSASQQLGLVPIHLLPSARERGSRLSPSQRSKLFVTGCPGHFLYVCCESPWALSWRSIRRRCFHCHIRSHSQAIVSHAKALIETCHRNLGIWRN